MSGRFAEMILSVCMLLAVELGGFDVEIGTGRIYGDASRMGPGTSLWRDGRRKHVGMGRRHAGIGRRQSGTRRKPVRMDRAGRKPGQPDRIRRKLEQPVRIGRSLEQSDRIRRKLEQPVRIRRSLEKSDRIRWKREHSVPAGGRRRRGTTG